MNFKEFIDTYSVPDYSLRKNLIKGFLSFWIVIIILPIFVFSDYIYDVEIFRQNFKDDLYLSFFDSCPLYVRSFIKTHTYIVSIAVCLVVVVQYFEKKFALLWATLLCLLFNFHFRLTSLVGSGATVIVSTFLAYIVLLELLEYLESKTTSVRGFKNYIFFAMKIQICMVYLVSGLVKAFSPLWTSGAAMYYIFLNGRYFKFPLVVDQLLSSDFVLASSAIFPLLYLFMFPIMIWTRKRGLIVFVSFVFHGFIALGMGLREFLVFPVLDYLLFCDVNLILNALQKCRARQFSEYLTSLYKAKR